uniref:GOLD domain-containing protein n=1 Tax=Meloidogyne enterolobii TaxID=390850 RepID=A0A6V7TI09_MELEN|nr:unnamed protein product [Meloidogyne enterolobii]
MTAKPPDKLKTKKDGLRVSFYNSFHNLNFFPILKIAAKDKLNDLQLRVRQLLDQVEQITKEQNYQRYREERFRQTSEGTNSRVLWWSAGQTIVLLLTGWWQIRHLRGFFEAKKLV